MTTRMDSDHNPPTEARRGAPGRDARRRSEPVRTLVVDRQAIVRYGLVRFLNEEGMEVCGEAADARDALRLVRERDPDLIVLDPSLDQGEDGLQLIRRLREEAPDVPMLAFSTMEEVLYAERALRAGASGFLMKRASTVDLLQAIHDVLEGELHVSGRVRKALLRRVAGGRGQRLDHPLGALTDRELEVFRLLGGGYSTRQVAESLDLSAKTVETHRSKIMRKLQLENATQLLHRAIMWAQFGSAEPEVDRTG